MSGAKGVLLESPRGIVSTDFAGSARCVRASQTRLAVTTGGRQPFNTYPVADLEPRALSTLSKSGHNANSFMTTHLAFLCRSRKRAPGIAHNTHIAVADPRVRESDQYLARTGCWCVYFHDLGRDGAWPVINNGFVP
jgi:hypothetical protein